jgi:hypothetical protein
LNGREQKVTSEGQPPPPATWNRFDVDENRYPYHVGGLYLAFQISQLRAPRRGQERHGDIYRVGKTILFSLCVITAFEKYQKYKTNFPEKQD